MIVETSIEFYDIIYEHRLLALCIPHVSWIFYSILIFIFYIYFSYDIHSNLKL